MTSRPPVEDIEAWVRGYVQPIGPLQALHQKAWATVMRVPIAGGVAWFKACAALQAFEPRLTATLFQRWPDRVVQVLGYDQDRGWLLLADAGTPVGDFGNPPDVWLDALPRYAELQKGETAYVRDHLAHGVPDLRLSTLPERYAELLELDLPLDREELQQLARFAPRFTELCEALEACGVPETIQHDDLHHANLYVRGRAMRVIDWGDASISHPFASLVVTFRFLEERAQIAPTDAWFARVRDAYLEPWGRNLGDAFELAFRVGTFTRAIAYIRQRSVLTVAERALFDPDFSVVLRRALRQM